MDAFPPIFQFIRWQDIVDFLIVYYLIYRTLLLIKGTRAIQVLTGFGIVIIVFLLSRNLGLYTLHTLLGELLSPLVIIVIVLFQDDIRRALAHVGKNPFFTPLKKFEDIHLIDEVLKAAYAMSERKIGALIVMEREMGLKHLIEEGIKLDATVDSDLLISMFLPYGPIHDGAVIIQGGRIIGAGCFLPPTQATNLPKQYGSRYRAALGLSEQSDALVIIVSEETSDVSLVVDGRVKKALNSEEMSQLILEIMERKT